MFIKQTGPRLSYKQLQGQSEGSGIDQKIQIQL